MPSFFQTSASRQRSVSSTSQSADTTAANGTLDQLRSLKGHPGCLTPSEQTALERFRLLVTEAGLYTPASGSASSNASAGTGRASHSDATLCRFLRARKFDPEKALKQFTDAETWRKQHNVDELYRTFPADEFELAKKYYPTWTGRRDKRGLPVYVYRLGLLDSKIQKELNAVPMERRYERIISLYEYMFNGVLNLCAALAPTTPSSPQSQSPSSPRLRSQVCSTVSIIDLSSVSLTQLWSIRSHLQQASTLATANYPETLESIFVVHSPSFFPTVWGWINGWFDPGTREKIKVLGNPMRDEGTRKVLEDVIGRENLPKMYGGELDWAPGDAPALEPEAREWFKKWMGLEGEVPLRGPVVVDPYAGENDSGRGKGKEEKRLSAPDSGVGLESASVPVAVAAAVPLPPTPAA